MQLIECFTTTFLRAHSWLNWVPNYAAKIFTNGMVLTRALLIKHIKLLLSAIGIDPDGFTIHSYRVGGATSRLGNKINGMMEQ